MSETPNHHPSSCIPPPADYQPRSRPPYSGARGRDRGGRGGRGFKRKPGQPATFHRNYGDNAEDRLKYQPKDKFHRNEDDDYFGRIQDDEDDNNDEDELEKDEDADSNKKKKNEACGNDDDDEDDPLDAYMKSLEDGNNGNEGRAKSQSSVSGSVSEKSEEREASTSTGQVDLDKKGVRLDIDETDDIEESYYQFVEQTSKSKKGADLDDSTDESLERQNMVEYDQDGNILSVRKVKKEIDPLPSIDHSSINYEPFEKIFYQEHAEIEKLTQEQGEELRAKLEIKVSGENPPKPVCSFAHFRFDEQLMRVIRRSEYTQPTPIQAQAIPAALLGRNIIGIAVTGSGKTAAYLWPMVVHIMGQPDLKRGDGPIALVLVPTRELALQVYGEARKFASSYKIAVVCAYGGGSKYEQSKDLEAGAEIVVATPGRMIDLIKSGVTNLKRVTYLVLDEADRFFEMGFETQVRSICDHIRPDRQTLLFSATFKKKIEQLARTVTDNPVKIVQKTLGEANEDVTQRVVVLSGPDGSKKWDWLTSRLGEFTSAGSVLIFVTRIINSEELHKNLKELGTETLLLHGDMEQSERNRVITLFKRREKDIMIATDVAARGLDISHIRTVINYDVARDIDTHIHRVGRTGRAGTKGDAYTLMTDKDKEFAGHLVKNFEFSNQEVGSDLMKLAMNSQTFRKSRGGGKHHGGKHHHNPHHRNHYDGGRHHHSSSSHSSSHRGSTDYQRHDKSSYRHDDDANNHHRHQHRDHNRSQSYYEERKRPRWQS